MSPSSVSRAMVFGLPARCFAVLAVLASAGAAQDLGELKIEGTHIAHLVLRRSGGRTEKWSDLEGSIRLPVGTYTIKQLELDGGRTCQTHNLAPVEVTKEEPAVLKAGGPLRQKIDVTRRGRTLTLNYRLLGIGDESYAPPRQPSKRPTFTVYRGEKAIATGTFDYG